MILQEMNLYQQYSFAANLNIKNTIIPYKATYTYDGHNVSNLSLKPAVLIVRSSSGGTLQCDIISSIQCHIINWANTGESFR